MPGWRREMLKNARLATLLSMNWLYHSQPSSASSELPQAGFTGLGHRWASSDRPLGGSNFAAFRFTGRQLHLQPDLQLVETLGFHGPLLTALLELGLVPFLRHRFVVIQSVPLVTRPSLAAFRPGKQVGVLIG